MPDVFRGNAHARKKSRLEGKDHRHPVGAPPEPLGSLRAVLAWAFGRSPAAELVDVVTQDEFTHDVIFRASASAYLVFDTT